MAQLTIDKCAFCGQFIPKGRSDKGYCSSSCKQKAYRWRIKQQRYASDAALAIANLASYIDYPEMQYKAVGALQELKKHIDAVMAEHGVRKVGARG
jgi:Fe-S-cluster-containing dehydrogenase component